MLHDLTEGQFIMLIFGVVVVVVVAVTARSILYGYFRKEQPMTIEEQVQAVRIAIWPYDQYISDDEIKARLRKHVTMEAAIHEMRFNIGRHGKP